MILGAAADGPGAVLLDILVVLAAAKATAEVAERLRVPAVVGEILAGIAIGPSLLGLVESGEVLRALGEIGVILLLLEVGLEMDLRELRAVGRTALLVAAVGVALPFAAGAAVAAGLGHGGTVAVFVGAALTATSVGITARVFGDLRALARVEARTVLGAAVADDVLGLVILTVVVRLVSEGSVSFLDGAGVLGVALLFLVVTVALGARLAPAAFRLVQARARSAGTPVTLVLALTLAFAVLADAVHLAPIVGAFVAGLSLGRSEHSERIRRDLAPVGHLLIPVFFLQIGIDVDVGAALEPSVMGLAMALLAVAVVGKLAAGVGAIGSPGDKAVIGLGMLPRGEVGLIFAGIGLREGVLGQDLYAALLLVVLTTTLATPPLLRWRLGHAPARLLAPAPSGPEPPGGYLHVEDGVVELAGTPPPHMSRTLALRAALMVSAGRPAPRLLDWLASVRDVDVPWQRRDTTALIQVLRDGNARSWRFLEATGTLDRALPELAEAMRRRREDPFELEPDGLLRWPLVDRVHDLGSSQADSATLDEYRQLRHPERLSLAALILETVGEDTPRVKAARQLALRLDLGAEAEQEIALLVADSELLRAAALRPDGLAEAAVLHVATHLEHPERARALYLLTLAVGELEPWQRRRLDELHLLVQASLAHPELTGREAANAAERRRIEAMRLVTLATHRDRLVHAPTAFLLGRDPEDLARQAALMEPLPGRAEARVEVTGGPDRWHVDVACRDRRGLLAKVAGVLSGAGLHVVDASVATWGDGGALESFQLRTAGPVDADGLRRAIVKALRSRLAAEPIPGATIAFDQEGSPWYTLCDVQAADRPGLLSSLAGALAVSGADIHSARVVTDSGVARARFELTDGRGEKLGSSAKDAIRATVAEGVRHQLPVRARLARFAERPQATSY